MSQEVRILCVDDETNVLKSLSRLFMDEDYEILTAPCGQEGLKILEKEAIQLVISDYRMPSMDGIEFLREVCERWPATIRIVLSGYADTGVIVSAINEGQIYKFIPKPWNDDELKVTIAKAIEVYYLNKRNRELTRELTDANQELTIINQNLERLVEERTSSLQFKNTVLTFAHNILNALPVAVLGIDPSGLIVHSNSLADDIFTCGNVPTLTNLPVETCLPADLADDFRQVLDGREIDRQIRYTDCRLIVKGRKMKQNDQQGVILTLVQLPREQE